MKKYYLKKVPGERKNLTKHNIENGLIRYRVRTSNLPQKQSRGGPPEIPTRPTSIAMKKMAVKKRKEKLKDIKNNRIVARKIKK